MKLPVYPALLLASFVFCHCSPEPSTPLSPVPLEHIETGGELARRIHRNFDRMETPLYQPEKVYWTEKESGGWPADKEGRTILALTLDARASHRQPKYLSQLIDMLPSHLNEKGYLGTIHPGVDEQQLSGHGWLLRGLCEYYDWTGDERVLGYAKTIADSLFLPILPYVGKYPSDPSKRVADTGDMSGSAQNTVNGWRLSSDVGCVFIGMEGLIHYYRYDRDPRIGELIDELIGLYLSIDLVRIKAQTHASLTGVRGLLRYAALTGNDTLVAEADKRWQTYKHYGMTENFENYNWFGRYDTWTEPCAIIDSYLAAVQLWAATRRPDYLEDAEMIYLNGIAATQRENGGFGCDKPVGVDFHDLSIHADEAHWCCTMRGGEGLSRAAQYAYFTAGDTLFVPFYRTNRLTIPEKGLTLTQNTRYPFDSTVVFRFEKAPRQALTLALPAPSYLRPDEITLNGETLPFKKENGFLLLTRTFAPQDEIALRYSFAPSWQPLLNRDIADTSLRKAMFGPLVLGNDGKNPMDPRDARQAPQRIGDSFRFTTASGDTLRPLYHLLAPDVSLRNKYRRGVIGTWDVKQNNTDR